METIRHHDHSNTPGARKRRKAAQRRWVIAGLTTLIVAVGVVQASGGPVPAEAVEADPARFPVEQAELISTGIGTLSEVAESALQEPEAEPTATEEAAVVEPEPEWFTVEATAYCSCAKCCGEWAYNRPDGVVYTADGSVAQTGVTIAADWDVFPAGTVLYIEGLGERIVQDRGGAITGYDVDVYHDDHNEALQFGRQHLQAYVVSYGG